MREHFPGLAKEREAVLDAVLDFFEGQLQGCFPEPDYTFDVYLTSANKVRVHRLSSKGDNNTVSFRKARWDHYAVTNHQRARQQEHGRRCTKLSFSNHLPVMAVLLPYQSVVVWDTKASAFGFSTLQAKPLSTPRQRFFAAELEKLSLAASNTPRSS